MPVVIGAFIGLLMGGGVGTALFGLHGGLIGSVIGLLFGTFIMLLFRSAWGQAEISKSEPPEDAHKED